MPRAAIYLIVWRVGSLSYTPRVGIYLAVRRVGSLSYTPRAGICLVVRRVGNLSYASRPSVSRFSLVRVSVSHRVMKSVGSLGGWGSVLNAPC